MCAVSLLASETSAWQPFAWVPSASVLASVPFESAVLASVLASTQPNSVPSAMIAVPLLVPMPSTMFVVWGLVMAHQLQELAADGAGVGAGANLCRMTPTRRGGTSD